MADLMSASPNGPCPYLGELSVTVISDLCSGLSTSHKQGATAPISPWDHYKHARHEQDKEEEEKDDKDEENDEDKEDKEDDEDKVDEDVQGESDEDPTKSEFSSEFLI